MVEGKEWEAVQREQTQALTGTSGQPLAFMFYLQCAGGDEEERQRAEPGQRGRDLRGAAGGHGHRLQHRRARRHPVNIVQHYNYH